VTTLAELFLFESMGQQWAYTSGDAPVEYNGVTYEPVPIRRGNAEQTQDINKNDLQIKVARDNDIGLIHLQYAPEAVTSISVFQREEGGAFGVFWKGRITGARADGSEITLMCESVFTSMRQPGLRARYQKNCRHAVYGRGCRLDPEDFAVVALLESVSGVSLVVPDAALQPNDWYLGGMLRAPDGSLRMITNHSGSTIEITRPILYLDQIGYGFNYGMDYGTPAVKLYPGCNRVRSTCLSKFNNVDNFGGFPWIPSVNPFGGSSIL
jgi:uncharacterized phage protein (TIGR02218 family)